MTTRRLEGSFLARVHPLLGRVAPAHVAATCALPLVIASGCGASSASKGEANGAENANASESATASGEGASATKDDSTTANASSSANAANGAPGAPPGAKGDPCAGPAFANLEDVLMKSACEVPNLPPDAKPMDPALLEVKLDVRAPKVTPGGHLDFNVVFTNKSKAPLPLFFTIDPLPRFETQAYNGKGVRVDVPEGNPPPLKAGIAPRVPGDPHTARVTLDVNGTARMPIAWDAVKTRWAPEKLRGTPPEKGYPKKGAGPLPKGKYTLRVVVPITNVFEGVDHEVSQPRAEIELAK